MKENITELYNDYKSIPRNHSVSTKKVVQILPIRFLKIGDCVEFSHFNKEIGIGIVEEIGDKLVKLLSSKDGNVYRVTLPRNMLLHKLAWVESTEWCCSEVSYEAK